MRNARILALTAVFGALLTWGAPPAAAQSDILLQLRSGNPPGDRFRVDSAGGVVAIGQLGIGIIPSSGQGWRMMWHPYRAAFRAGGINPGGTEWDDGNMGFYSWAGGADTRASQYATFAFGDGSTATANYAVAFGDHVDVSGQYGFGAGYQSQCTGTACVSLGYITNADGQGAVALGYRSTADASYSVAIGQRASTNGHSGAIVFADGSTTDSLEASANNQFSVRAAGGYRFYTNATTTVGAQINAGGSSWSVISDRNRKEAFLDVDGEDLLMRLRRVPVTTWRLRTEEDRTVRHIGPMAQDWHAAFGFSSDDTMINMSDLDGVNLAAVKALEARSTEQAERIRTLEAELAELREMVRAMAAPKAQP
jgi:hypothetical protein